MRLGTSRPTISRLAKCRILTYVSKRGLWPHRTEAGTLHRERVQALIVRGFELNGMLQEQTSASRFCLSECGVRGNTAHWAACGCADSSPACQPTFWGRQAAPPRQKVPPGRVLGLRLAAGTPKPPPPCRTCTSSSPTPVAPAGSAKPLRRLPVVVEHSCAIPSPSPCTRAPPPTCSGTTGDECTISCRLKVSSRVTPSHQDSTRFASTTRWSRLVLLCGSMSVSLRSWTTCTSSPPERAVPAGRNQRD